MGRLVLSLIACALSLTCLADAAPQSDKVLGRSSTTRSYTSLFVPVYLRDDPDYTRELRSLRAELRRAQAELQEARDSIEQVGELTPAQRKARDEFLAPYVRAVKETKADLAALASDYDKPYRAYGFRVQTNSPETATLEWTTSCKRGRAESKRDGAVTRTTEFEVWRPPTFKHSYTCYLRAFVKRSAGGRLVLTVLGRR